MAEHPQAGRPRGAQVVALTGGIASGKSTVAELFAKRGVEIIDTDVIARNLVAPGQPMLGSIVQAFGHELLDAYGRLKRRMLRELIFRYPDKRRQLEALMHPEIASEARRQISEVRTAYCILVIPLLAETGGFEGIDRVLVVDAAPATQLSRLAARDEVSAEEAKAALAAQASREQRLAFADDVISNDGSLQDLEARVEQLHQGYLELSQGADRGR